MKKFNRVLAMLLALVTVLAMLPISAIADTWLNVEAKKETTDNVTSTDITVTVDPKALLSYLQDGDLKGLLKGVSATGGLGSIMTKEELLAIIPEEQLIDLVKSVIADIDAKELLACIDADALLACVDKAGLVALLKEIDLQAYVKDVDALMGYIGEDAIEEAVAYIDTDALINDYSSELMDLALGLAPSKLFEIVEIDSAVKLAGIKLEDAANLTYFKETIGYGNLANNYVNKEALNDFVDANVARFSATLPAYVNKNALSGLFDGVKDQLADYMNADNAEAIVRDAYDAGAFDGVDLTAYINGENINVEAMIADGILADLYDELLSGDGTNPAAFDVKVLLFGDAVLDPLFPDLAGLITANVLKVEDLLDNSVIAINELIANEVVDVDKLATVYGYENLVKIEVIKSQITTAIETDVLPVADVVACLKDYTAAIEAIGVNAAVDAIPGGYKTLMEYVTDFKALINTFDVEGIAVQIVKDRAITTIVDAKGLIKAINLRALVSKIDIKQAVKVIYQSGVAGELMDMLDFKAYLVQAFNILATMQKTITEIEIDGVVITEQNNSGYIQLLPARLIDAIENLVPSLNELANLDDSGKLFTASFAISYLDEEGVELTKEINFNFVLTAGTDMIRKAAAKLSVLLDKVGYIGLAGGELVADITVPSEFASVLRIALEKMADSNDPEFNALKDKVLAVYAAHPDDFIAFAEGLTFEEVVAVLDAVDPALFGKVYNKALASRYAQVLLAYVERVTGYDLSDNLEAQNLVNTLAEIPTFEVFVQKLENVTGIEITDRLPGRINGYLDHTVYDVIEKLAAHFGYDFDMQNLLKQAAASPDPFAYLYTAVINKVENASGIYNFVQRNAVKVADRLMATRFGAVIADNCLMDFYRGNSTFVFDKGVTFDAKIVLEKGINRILGKLSDYAPGVASKLDYVVDETLDILISDGTTVHTGFDVTVHVNNLYRVDFVNEYGSIFLSTLLPAGTNLSKMVDYSGVEGFNGWINTATGAYVTVMPKADVVLKADVQGVTEHTVTIVPVIDGKIVADKTATITVLDGQKLGKYLPNLNEAAATLYPALSEVEAVLGYAYAHTWDDSIFQNTVEGDLTVYATISLNKNAADAAIQIGDLVAGEDFEITLANGVCTIVLAKDWNTVIEEKGIEALNFSLAKDLLATLNTLVLTADVVNAQKVTLNKEMLALLVYDANALNVDVDKIGLTYAPKANATQGAESYEFTFNYDGVATDVGEFKDGATVAIVLPFAGKNGADGVKTFVDVDGEPIAIEVTEGTVAFNAPHFSTVTIVNKYRVTVDAQYAVEAVPADQLPVAAGPIAVLKDGKTLAEYYAPGDVIEGEYESTANVPAGLVYEKTMFNDTAFTGSFTMPAEPVTVTHYAKANTYNVYYYVNGQLQTAMTKTYTILSKPTVESLTSVVPAGYTDTTGWFWYGAETITENTLCTKDFHLFWINPVETDITVNFYKSAADSTPAKSYTYSVAEWRDTYFVKLQAQIELDVPGYTWANLDNSKTLADYTLGDFMTLGTINLYGTKVEKQYNIFVNGDVTVDKTVASEGDTITITTNKVGYTATLKVYTTLDGTQVGDLIDVVEGTFTMPASNVMIEVLGYTANSITYTDKDGNEQTGTYGDVHTIVITVPAGYTLRTDLIPGNDISNLSSAPAGLVLVSAVRSNDGSLVLTYQYTLTETVDEKAFIAQVKANIQPAEYAVVTYIVNGVAYATEAEALANLPKGAEFAGWTQISANVMVAVLEYAATSQSAWLIVCIVLAVLLLIALIVLVYVLHITDRIGTNWLTKVCTAIVTVFFAFCMLVAKVALKILNFVGVKDEDILEELPEEPVEDVPAVLIDPETLSTEEAAVEETAEEVPAEEAAVEETAEEVPAEEAAVEETAEEAPAEEAAVEETAEEAPAEEAAVEETAEEVPAEEAAVEETAEEAPVEEAAVEETAEEAPVEEAAVEETAEEAPAEEAAVEETAEEAPAEEAAVEETAEEEAETEAVEEAPVEEATEEAAEEEKKDE